MRRSLSCCLCAGVLTLACTASLAQGASTVIAGLNALFAEHGLQARSAACSQRFLATAAAWSAATRRIRQDNAAVFDELAQLAQRYTGPDNPDPQAQKVARDFRALAEMAPSLRLGPLGDSEAAAVCNAWLGALGPGGEAELHLPGVLAAAQKLRAQR